MATAATHAKSSTNGRSKAQTESLEDQVEQLRNDIQALAGTIGNIASGKVDRVKGKADETRREFADASEQAMETIRTQYRDTEAALGAQVREKPLQALGIAAGIGFLFAMLTRR